MRPCTIAGNVGRDPEMRYTPSGSAVTDFSLALYGGKSEDGEAITTWVRVTCWKDLAEAVNHKVAKGDKIQCEGYLQPPRLYETKSGETKASLELTAFSVMALEWSPQDIHSMPDITTMEHDQEEVTKK